MRVRVLVLTFLLLGACTHTTPRSAPATTTTTLAAAGQVVTLTGITHVSGTFASLDSASATTDPLATPFTLTVPDAGRGGFSIAGAVVNGKPETIVWSGGRPLPVTGTCTLDVGETHIGVTTSTAIVWLDGGVRALTAGTCAFGSSVAVGASGLASPEPSVSFQLPQDATFEPSGGTQVSVPPARHYEGRHGDASLAGTFTVTSKAGDTWHATKVVLGKGTWLADITATPTGMHVEAQFDGDQTIQTA